MNVYTRRRFLKSGLLGGALGITVPSFFDRTVYALDALAAARPDAQMATGKDHTILVVLQLAGGNDGLNTVIPHSDDGYYRARPRIGLKTDILPINESTSLHPSLENFRQLHDSGNLCIIEGVGYPNPNRSHFRSTDIWQTASDSDELVTNGWLGRYFDAACCGADPIGGVAVTGQEPLAMKGENPHSLTFQNARSLEFAGSSARTDDDLDLAYEEMLGEEAGGSVMEVSGSATNENQADFLQRVAMGASLSSDRILSIANKFQPTRKFPASKLARSLELVSGLISGGFPARVYYVSLGGFDTHSGQLGAHAARLRELDTAVGAFVNEMRAQKNLDRVTLMTFSEFGRRVAENANAGTDHGAAAPLFMIGGSVRPGFHGQRPSLIDLNRGDLIHSVDFRSVYATVLEDWLQTPSSPVLGRHFEKIGVIGSRTPA